MNHRRSKPRDKGSRGKSSDWSYPQLEKGHDEQSSASNKRRAMAANEQLRQDV